MQSTAKRGRNKVKQIFFQLRSFITGWQQITAKNWFGLSRILKYLIFKTKNNYFFLTSEYLSVFLNIWKEWPCKIIFKRKPVVANIFQICWRKLPRRGREGREGRGGEGREKSWLHPGSGDEWRVTWHQALFSRWRFLWKTTILNGEKAWERGYKWRLDEPHHMTGVVT